jgi:hypothetical protein
MCLAPRHPHLAMCCLAAAKIPCSHKKLLHQSMPAQQLVKSFLHHFIKPAQQLHRKLFQLRFRLPHGFRLRRRLCGRSLRKNVS